MYFYQRCFMIILSVCSLASCTYYHRPSLNTDLLNETWVHQVDKNASDWVTGVDHWFMQPGTSTVNTVYAAVPLDQAMSTTRIRVPRVLSHIKIQGAFQVQFFATHQHDSVTLYGPHELLKNMVIRVAPHSLSLSQLPKAPRNMRCVIVRIGIKQLRTLSQEGEGLIIGQLVSRQPLCIRSLGSGDIYLAGTIAVNDIQSEGSGGITLLGAMTPHVAIRSSGSGVINLEGNVGVNHIQHTGSGNVNIIGANTSYLTIDAQGQGKIGLYGIVALDRMRVGGWTHVYVDRIRGNRLFMQLTDHAQVGLEGTVKLLSVEADQSSRFAGSRLYARAAEVRVRGAAHANVTATHRLFASATQSGSIYYLGPTRVMTKIVKQNGVVLTVP